MERTGPDTTATQNVGPVPVVLGARAAPVIACTLSAVDIPDRLRSWASVLDQVTQRARLDDDALRLTFGSDLDLEDLARLVAAEQTCCSFFAFAITVDDRGVALEVRAPEDARGITTALFGTAS